MSRSLVPASQGSISMHAESAERRASQRLYRRLAWVAAGATAFSLLRIGAWLVIVLLTGGGWRPGPYNTVSTLLAAGLGALVALVSLRRPPSRDWFAPLALGYEVATAFLLGAGLMGWQSIVTSEVLDAWFVTRKEAPWSLGGGEVAWAGVWILLFALVVPLRPRVHLLGGALSIVALASWPTVSLLAHPVPTELGDRLDEVTLVVTLQLAFGALLCLGIGYWAARQTNLLNRRLEAARELGAYTLIEKLGGGGMGEVWVAEHRMLARRAAVKLVRRDGSDQRQERTLMERFEREVQATSQLDSPHTIQVYDYGFSREGTFYYVMELLDGLDLEDLVLHHGAVPPARVVQILRQICRSLDEAHARGLVHRDMKPANVMLCRVGLEVDFVKVLDFGLVKSHGTETGSSPSLTAQLTFAGTPAYAAPEVAQRGADQATPASDLYSLGCVAYWLLSGRQVFEAQSPVEMLSRHISGEIDPLGRVVDGGVPQALEQIVMSCLAKDPERRPASAGNLARQLAETGIGNGWTEARASEWWSAARPDAGVGATGQVTLPAD